MSNDTTFLKCAELKGAASAKGFEGQIGLYSMNHGLSLNCFAGGGTEGRTSGVCNHSDISITKVMDDTSVKIYEHCCNATPFAEMVITVCRQVGDKLEPLITYTLKDVLISSVNTSAGGGNPTESVTLNYTNIKWEFTKQAEGGKVAGKYAAKWDVQKNSAS